MGLDMYLTKRTSLANYSFSKNNNFEVTIKKGGKVFTEIIPDRVTYIIEEVAYWRKANHIHKWFVDNVQDGKDDCREYYVSHNVIKTLVEVCKEVKANLDKSPKVKKKVKAGWSEGEDIMLEIEMYSDTAKAEALLPTSEGFFFGNTEYSEDYYQDLVITIEQLEPLLKEKSGAFYYQASW